MYLYRPRLDYRIHGCERLMATLSLEVLNTSYYINRKVVSRKAVSLKVPYWCWEHLGNTKCLSTQFTSGVHPVMDALKQLKQTNTNSQVNIQILRHL